MTTSAIGGRIECVDALRGVALFGIAFGNVMWFSGTAVMAPEQRVALGTDAIDTGVRQLVHVLIDGKFYSLFAFLFGVGFGLAVQPGRDIDAACAAFRRRMLALGVLGGLHATLLWFGDIISLYAVTGMLLPLFARCADRTLLRWSIGLLAAPIPLSLAIWASSLLSTGGSTRDPGHGPMDLLAGFAAGDYAAMLGANLEFLRERWLLALYSGRFCKLLGLFVFGLWSVRRGFVQRPGEHQESFLRVLRLALVIGIPANLALAWFLTNVPERPPSLLGCVRSAVYATAVPSLALAYAAGAALLLPLDRCRRIRRGLANVGRMTMTHYVTQSVVGIAVFYGIGFGLWGAFGEAVVVGFLPVLFAVHVVVGRLWLARFRSGPIESWTRALHRRLGPVRGAQSSIRTPRQNATRS